MGALGLLRKSDLQYLDPLGERLPRTRFDLVGHFFIQPSVSRLCG